MAVLRKIFWLLAAIGSIIGGFDFFVGLSMATGATQQAAGAAIALCWAVLPYVFARAIDEAMANPPMP